MANINKEEMEKANVLNMGSDLAIREVLGQLLSSLASAERKGYLEGAPSDKGNGFYARNLSIGSLPVDINVPRVRSGDFRPLVLPDKHKRGYPEEMQNLLLGLLISSRSISSAKKALSQMGLSVSEDDLENVVSDVLKDFELRQTGPLNPDFLAIFMDAKYIEVREDPQLKPYSIYLVVGLTMEGHKRVLACVPEEGRESLECWKKVLRKLIERGLRRILITVQDDFTGLSGIIESYFPKTNIQLCTVHMLRNARKHMSKEDANLFVQQFRAVRHSWSVERAYSAFEETCQYWKDKYPDFMSVLAKKKTKYLAFINMPQSLKKTFSTTNAVEVINRQFEKIRLNNSGYFQSLPDLKLKLGLSIQSLENGVWKKPTTYVRENLQHMNALFEKQFEHDHD